MKTYFKLSEFADFVFSQNDSKVINSKNNSVFLSFFRNRYKCKVSFCNGFLCILNRNRRMIYCQVSDIKTMNEFTVQLVLKNVKNYKEAKQILVDLLK